MKTISIWNPFATLLAHGHKTIETRSWPAPKSLIGQRIGIASTKVIRPEQKAAFADAEFRKFYDQTGLPQELSELPHGYLLGSAILHSCDVITDEDLEDITEEEKLYGWFREGYYAWRMRAPELLPEPIPVRGAQGVWVYRPEDAARAKIHLVREGGPRQEGPEALRRDPHERLVG